MPTVVIADDSPTLRRIVGGVLTAAGFEVVAEEDGVGAVRAASRVQPDVVVLDVQMPRMPGYVASRLLKEHWSTRDIPVVLLTSLDAASDRYWGGKAGADRYLTKDFEAEELVDAVNRAIDEARARRGGRDRLRPDPVELTDDDVLERTCDVLDRTLFAASLAGEVTHLAATVVGFEATVSAVLDVLGGVVDASMAGVVLSDDGCAYVRLGREASREHLDEFLARSADVLGQPVEALSPRLADPTGLLGADDEMHLATYLSMPLRGHGGREVGVLALSSSQEEAFGESTLRMLQLVETPVALVVDNARMADARVARAGLRAVG